MGLISSCAPTFAKVTGYIFYFNTVKTSLNP